MRVKRLKVACGANINHPIGHVFDMPQDEAIKSAAAGNVEILDPIDLQGKEKATLEAKEVRADKKESKKVAKEKAKPGKARKKG